MNGSSHQYIVFQRTATSGDVPQFRETSAAPEAFMTMTRDGILLLPVALEPEPEPKTSPQVESEG